jgi:adenylate kinase
MNLSIVGTKGAGKGTQIARLVTHLNLVHFAPGELCRHAVKKKTPLGQIAEKHILRGELVPDDIINGMVEEWLWTTSPVQNIAFDGFPRTTYQVTFLEATFKDLGRKLDALVYLDVSDETVIERLSARRRCRVCAEEFHLTSAPFRVCPYSKCEGQYLKQLDEDQPEVISTLMNIFRRGIQPLLDHYEKTDQLVIVSGEGSAEEVHGAIIAAVSRFA